LHSYFYSECKRLLKIGNKTNKFNVHLSNSIEHERLKLDVFYLLRKHGFNVVSEARFVGGGEVDCLDIDRGVAFEILHTEEDINLKAKKKLYPSFLTLVPIRTGSLSFEELERLIT